MHAKKLLSLIKLKHLAYAALCFIVLKILMKFLNFGQKVASAGATGVGIGAGIAGETMAAISSPFVYALKKITGSSTAKKANPEERIKIEAAYKAGSNERLLRARKLLADFTSNKSLRVRFLSSVFAPELAIDKYGAMHKTGDTKFFAGRKERASCYIQSVSKEGTVIFLDVVNKKRYAVSAHIITLEP